MRLVLIVILFLLIFSQNLLSQFYNGLQMDFGKNRVQYKEFVWQYYRFSKYDTYFYVGGKELAVYTANVAERKINEFEMFFGYTLEKRIIFLIYNNLSDFRQSNIGLISGNDNYNIGGVTQIVDNKVFLFFDGDHKNFEQQINAAIAEVIINEMLWGSDLRTKVANNTLLTLPEWFYKGLISYLSNEWDVEIENRVRDGILSGKYEKFNRLSGEDAIYAGHSIWYFVGEKFGKKVIPNILYISRISKSSESGFLYVLGLPLKHLSFEWLHFFDQRYYEDNLNRDFPTENKANIKVRKNRVYQDFKYSPDGKYFAYATNRMGKIKVFLVDKQTGKRKKIYKQGHKLDQITDYSYPVIEWHPSGLMLTFITETKGAIWLWFYDMETSELSSKEMFNVDKIIDYSFSNRGTLITLSALKDGQTDIYVFNNLANTYEQITNDKSDDRFPRFTNGDKKIIFSSTRTNDTLGIDKEVPGAHSNYNVYLYDYAAKDNLLTVITNENIGDVIMPFPISNNNYMVKSNINGIYNRYIAQFDSSVSHIDTTIHYRYFSNIYPQTNYSRNIETYDYNYTMNSVSEILFKDNRYHLIESEFKVDNELSVPQTSFWKKIVKRKAALDSLANVKEEEKELEYIMVDLAVDSAVFDTTNIDFRNYYFEFQKNKLRGALPVHESVSAKNKEAERSDIFSRQRLYMTTFYTNYFVSQVDFGFVNNSYQAFTGGAVYFNPGFNVFFKIGTNDLFEDYKITGAVRLAGNFDSNEYLLTLENLKKRLDKQWVFHRVAFTNILNYAIFKSHSHEIMYRLSYPFSQVMSVRGSTLLRHDRGTFLSTDIVTLKEDFQHKLWAGLKGELVFDNTRVLQLNIFSGTRFKVFGEYYQQVDKKQSDLYVVGADFRFYQRIHRNFISASRFAGSSSFGNSKLIYYLGSVDNWINLSPRVETFDRSIPIDYSKNYVYQTLATNMRGFSQNIRNGNNFVAFNQELRWPVVKYFMNRPINSDFFENFQIVSFFDVGTAWVGQSPYSKENAYNTEIINRGPITVIIDKERNPFVYGYGFGLRTRMLGYFIRADWAWGVENNIILPRIFYLSLSLDF